MFAALISDTTAEPGPAVAICTSAGQTGCIWIPPPPYLLVPGTLTPRHVNLDDVNLDDLDLDGLDRWPHPGRRQRGWEVARLARLLPRRTGRFRGVDWPLHGPAIVWHGRLWVVHRPPPAPVPGTDIGDLDVLLSRTAADGDRLAALERTVDRIAWRPRRPSVRRALAARTADGSSAETVKRQELRAAVYLVLAERGRPQTHRFGRSWVIGADGRTAAVMPERLSPPLFWRWFCDEVRKAAEASLVGDTYPAEHAGESHAAALTLSTARAEPADLEADPLACLLAKERRQEAAAWWHAALGEATPRQRALLHSLAALIEASPRAEAPARLTLAEAAKRAGMAASTARVHWQRLVRRLRALGQIALAHPG